MLEPGARIDGYRVQRLLGEGGMGAVYAVTDEHGSSYAMKVLLDTSDATLTKRFLREAKTTAKLTSANVTRIYGTGALTDGTPYLLMELLHGEDLGEVVARRGALSCHEAVSYVLEVCDALSEAHGLGMVHRDIKPANLFAATLPDGTRCTKLLDFGISKPALNTVAPVTQLTQTGTVLGSPEYMAPEQLVSSSEVDARADIWALGVTLQELLTGAGVFVGETLAEVVTAIMRDPPRSLRAQRPDVPDALEAVIRRCLEKDPELRFASVTELAEALRTTLPAQSSQRVTVTPSGAGGFAGRQSAHADTIAQGTPAAAWASLPATNDTRAPTLVTTPSAAPVAPRVMSVAPQPTGRSWWPIAALAALGVVVLLGGTFLGARLAAQKAKDSPAAKNSAEIGETGLAGDRILSGAKRKRLENGLERAEQRLANGKLDQAYEDAQEILGEVKASGVTIATPSSLASRAADVMSRVRAAQALAEARLIRAELQDSHVQQASSHWGEHVGHAFGAQRWNPKSEACPAARMQETTLQLTQLLDERSRGSDFVFRRPLLINAISELTTVGDFAGRALTTPGLAKACKRTLNAGQTKMRARKKTYETELASKP